MTEQHPFIRGTGDYGDYCRVCGSSPEVCAYRQDSNNTNQKDTMTDPAPIQPPIFTATNDSITVLVQGVPKVVLAGTPQYAGLLQCILEQRWGDFDQYLTREGALAKYLASTDFRVDGDKIFDFSGAELPKEIAARILAMASAGEDPAPVVQFYKRLSLNPSRRSVQQLFSFLGHCGIPIEPDGTFLAYKGVREDFLDAHSGTLLNTPGTTQRMPRNQISDDPNHACHEGLHVGALEYAQGFSNRVVICRIDPANVVCVPYDYHCQKMRVCEYEVVGQYQPESESDVLPSTSYTPDVSSDEGDDAEWGGEVEYEGDDLDEADEPIPYTVADDVPVEAPTTPKPVRAKVLTGRPTAPKAAAFARKSPKALMEASIEDLRKYASHHLKIVGASKIPGGKSKLVAKILKARRSRRR